MHREATKSNARFKHCTAEEDVSLRKVLEVARCLTQSCFATIRSSHRLTESRRAFARSCQRSRCLAKHAQHDGTLPVFSLARPSEPALSLSRKPLLGASPGSGGANSAQEFVWQVCIRRSRVPASPTGCRPVNAAHRLMAGHCTTQQAQDANWFL